MWPNPKETADLVTFTEEIYNEKFHALCSVCLICECIYKCMSGSVAIFLSLKNSSCKKNILTIYFWQIMKKKPGQEKKTGKLDRNTQDLALTSTC